MWLYKNYTTSKEHEFWIFYCIALFRKKQLVLNKQTINKNLKDYFETDLSKIKSDEKLFDKLFEKGSKKLFNNITVHPNCEKENECDPNCHGYKDLVKTIFKK